MDIEILKDLLPSYIDGITSAASNRLIEQELQKNPELKKYYETMLTNLKVEPQAEVAEINSLKKIRRVNRRKIVLGVLSTFAVICLLIYGFFWYYNKSWQADSQEIVLSKTVSHGIVTLEFSDRNSRSGIRTLAFLQPDHDLQNGYQPELLIKQSRINPFDSPFEKSVSTGIVRLTFIDQNTLLVNNQEVKIGDTDILTLCYDDKTETIKIKDLLKESAP